MDFRIARIDPSRGGVMDAAQEKNTHSRETTKYYKIPEQQKNIDAIAK